MAYIHGYSDSQKDIDKGIKLREELSRLKELTE